MESSKAPRPATKVVHAQPWWVVYLPGTAAASAATFLVAGTYVGIKMGMKRGAKLDQQDAGSYVRTSASAGPGSVAESGAHATAPGAGRAIDARDAFHYKLPNAQGMTAGQLATKAFLYGTILCLAGSTVLGIGTAWYFDAWTLDAFARRMEEVVPRGKDKLEGWLQTPVSTRTAQMHGLYPGTSTSQPARLIVLTFSPAFPPGHLQLSAIAGSSKTFAEGVRGSLGTTIAEHVPPIRGIAPDEETAGLTSRDRKLLEDMRAMLEEADREATASAEKKAGVAKVSTPREQ